MNSTTRLLIVVFSNFVMVSFILMRASSMGIDLESSTLADNTGNLSFMFDFVSFLVVLFFINTIVLSISSKRSRTLREIIKKLETKEPHLNRKQHKKQPV